jgi:hypothetical protein
MASALAALVARPAPAGDCRAWFCSSPLEREHRGQEIAPARGVAVEPDPRPATCWVDLVQRDGSPFAEPPAPARGAARAC